MTELQSFGTPGAQRALLLSLPNILTYARIVAVPIVVFCIVGGQEGWRLAGFLIFVAASVTDYFDGWLARLWQQQSSIGRMLDPIADKLLVAASLLALVYERTIGGVTIWAAVIILSREILVSGLREYLAELRVSVPVTRLAKWKTTIQLVAVALLVAGPAGDRLFAYTTDTGLGLLWISAIVTLYTGYDYFRAGLGHILEEKP
ncbi:CDP-diacylglycerol--glycerol-3-phosphate 3-phosphatidyltransferase [Prosthecomicrobium pneumaticum]|uniref:CDP-diacylglycerol--glycerol-3-phosphate 3-phosphatidyltransferase n=1 Tax=Prosthecomicrobium pneumaticum TaxID=81895 RepID=A0A7W9FKS9_9HYPH|nr:CDP-diacylglycerol--glycerol-3-phosphate 3-phosphatidyltransferase [Prosthecomicrobium pneumaticum]MBB5751468.1 cardiolipin synthase [Prosthecomicrobium pneumaticum]